MRERGGREGGTPGGRKRERERERERKRERERSRLEFGELNKTKKRGETQDQKIMSNRLPVRTQKSLKSWPRRSSLDCQSKFSTGTAS